MSPTAQSPQTSPRDLGAQGAVVVVAGATSASGVAAVRALRTAGATAIAVGSNPERLEAAFGSPSTGADGGVPQRVCDLGDFPAVQSLAAELRETFSAVDGVIHLVGGWRGGTSLADQSDEDWAFLAHGSIMTLRNTSRAFYDDILGSKRGRFVIVSSTLIENPRPGYANYAAAKSAAETWVRAMGRGLAEQQTASAPGEGTGEHPAQTSAAVILAVKSLLDDDMRAAQPDRKFPGYTHVDDLAARIVDLFSSEAAEFNGARLDLTA